MKQLNRNHVFAFGMALALVTLLLAHNYKDAPGIKAATKGVVSVRDSQDKKEAQETRRKQALYNMELAAAHLDRASWQLAVARWKGSDPAWVKLMEEERVKAWTEVREAAADLADLK